VIKEKKEGVFRVCRTREGCRHVDLRPRQESFSPTDWCFEKAMSKL